MFNHGISACIKTSICAYDIMILKDLKLAVAHQNPDSIKTVYKITWLIHQLGLVNTHVWIRASKHGKFQAKSLLKFVLHVQSYYFTKETRNSFCVFEYCDSNTWYSMLLDIKIALKKKLVFPLCLCIETISLCSPGFDFHELGSDW